MAVDATGTPTSPDSIPTYATSADAPSGKGFNAAMAAIQAALLNRLTTTTAPGTELAYVELTANTANTGTEAAPGVVLTAPSVTLDGATSIWVELYIEQVAVGAPITAGSHVGINLWQSFNAGAATDVGRLFEHTNDQAAFVINDTVYGKTRIATPAAGTYVFSARGWHTDSSSMNWVGSTGGAGVARPGFLRVTRA